MNTNRASIWILVMVVSTSLGSPGISNADDEQGGERMKLLQTFMNEFVSITPGRGDFSKSFQMGAERGPKTEQPVHDVTIGYNFSIAKYEVPQNLYEAVMGVNPSRWKGVRNSAEMMTWRNALEFCRRITAMLREAKLIGDDMQIRLPTEAEWEYCCRAGTTTAYSFGDQARADGDEENKATLLDPYGWHTGNAAGNDPPVGALQPNPWGLYDVHGYLSEFCLDAWHADYTHAPADGSAWDYDPQREKGEIVIRGGSWKDKYPDLRSAARKAFDVTKGDDAVGFRCVMTKVIE